MLDLRQDHVTRARVTTPRALGARVRLAEATARGLHPDGLASEAILVLNRVAVAWEVDAADAGGLRAAVAERLTRAVRPGRGPVPEGADAVLFDSLEDLLACLARDGVAGRRPWWWRTLGLEPTAFAARWVVSPEALPGVVRRLAEAGALAEVARQIAGGEARELLRALVGQASLGALAEVVEALPAGRAVLPPGVRVATPWTVPGEAVVEAALPPPTEALVGVAAMLASSPEATRRPAFAEAVRRWAAEVAGIAAPSAPDDAASGEGVRSGERSPEAAQPVVPAPVHLVSERAEGPSDAPGAPVLVPVPPLSRVDPHPPPTLPVVDVPAPLPAHAAPGPVAVAAPPSVPPGPDTPLAATAVPHADAVYALPLPVSPPASPEPDPARTWIEPATFSTGLGGAFYLVNVLLALDLYGDFTQPARPEPEVPVWDVVAALAAALLPDPPADPLWAFLARLGGRPARIERPDGPPRPDDFAPPGEGWVVSRPLPPGFPRPTAPGTEAWLAAVLAGVRARLATAIALSPEEWLPQAARVRDHDHLLEVELRLSTHPIEVRLAGLDRDPGWIPAAGRDLRFRFDG